MNLNALEISYLAPTGSSIQFSARLALSKSNILTTLSIQESSYILRFQLFPLRFQTGWTSVIHFSAFGGNMKKYGDRNPGLFFHSSSDSATYNSLHICSPIDNNKNYCFDTQKIVPRN